MIFLIICSMIGVWGFFVVVFGFVLLSRGLFVIVVLLCLLCCRFWICRVFSWLKNFLVENGLKVVLVNFLCSVLSRLGICFNNCWWDSGLLCGLMFQINLFMVFRVFCYLVEVLLCLRQISSIILFQVFCSRCIIIFGRILLSSCWFSICFMFCWVSLVLVWFFLVLWVCCSRSLLWWCLLLVKVMKFFSNLVKIVGLLMKLFSSCIMICLIFWYRLLCWVLLCLVQFSDVDVILLSR